MKNWCKVIVKSSNGSALKGIKVVGAVSETLTCSGYTASVYTDNNGEATIEWSEGCKLQYIYIDGKEHVAKYYESGRSYRFTI